MEEKFDDISSELYREYVYPDGVYRIKAPCQLLVRDSSLGGHAHRVIDSEDVSHYIRPGWFAVRWKNEEGAPRFNFITPNS